MKDILMKSRSSSVLTVAVYWMMIILAVVNGQTPATGGGPGNNSMNGTLAVNGTNATNTTNTTCDPSLQLCPGVSCDLSTVRFGGIIVTSPNSTTFAFMNQSVELSWIYSPTTNTNRFPSQNVTVYYQRVGVNLDWTFLTTASNMTGNQSRISVTFPINLIPGDYRLRLLADNIELNEQFKIGRRVSCPADGFPAPGQSQPFFLLRPKVEEDYSADVGQDPYAPNTAISGSQSILLQQLGRWNWIWSVASFVIMTCAIF